MAAEKPEIRLHVELGAHSPCRIAAVSNLGDAVEHQHRGQRQLALPDRTARPGRSQQILVFVTPCAD
jgi:hypothetical protein